MRTSICVSPLKSESQRGKWTCWLERLLSKCRLCDKDLNPSSTMMLQNWECTVNAAACVRVDISNVAAHVQPQSGKTLVYLQSKCSRCEKVWSCCLSLVFLSLMAQGKPILEQLVKPAESKSVVSVTSSAPLSSVACPPVSIPFAVDGWLVFISSRLQGGTAPHPFVTLLFQLLTSLSPAPVSSQNLSSSWSAEQVSSTSLESNSFPVLGSDPVRLVSRGEDTQQPAQSLSSPSQQSRHLTLSETRGTPLQSSSSEQHPALPLMALLPFLLLLQLKENQNANE